MPFTGPVASCWVRFSTTCLVSSLPARLLNESSGNCSGGPELGCLSLSFPGTGEPSMLVEGGIRAPASSAHSHQGERTAPGGKGWPTASLEELRLRMSQPGKDGLCHPSTAGSPTTGRRQNNCGHLASFSHLSHGTVFILIAQDHPVSEGHPSIPSFSQPPLSCLCPAVLSTESTTSALRSLLTRGDHESPLPLSRVCLEPRRRGEWTAQPRA